MSQQFAGGYRPTMRPRRSLVTIGAFFFGVPLGLGLLALFLYWPFEEFEGLAEIQRYIAHEVEWIEVVLFCCGLGALLTKVLGQWKERCACRTQLVPAWDGEPLPVAEAGTLRAGLAHMSRLLQNTFLGRRIASILDFVHSRGAANELDDHMRTLADNDALAQEESYSLVRFITWAIPILGFLGTVLGITGAITSVNPEVLDKEMHKVTGGLALAFDATALALGLTMILMFCTFLVERLEQGTLAQVDHYVDEELAHRFERTGAESGKFVEVVRQNTQILLKATEQLVERQATVWGRSLERAERMWAEGANREQDRINAALEASIERTLTIHSQRLMDLEQKAVDRSSALFEGLTALAGVIRDTGREHQEVLAGVLQTLKDQAEVLGKLHEGEGELVRLQEAMQQNLQALAGAGAFEEAVQSLTAAIHLLTARATATPVAGSVRPVSKPGLAA